MSEPAIRVDAILFETTRPLEMARFYRDAFGCSEPRWFGESHVGVRAANTYLGFDRVDEPAVGRARTSIWFRVSDVPALFEHLKTLGARVKTAPEWESSPGETLARLYDPDGNEIGLIGPAPEAAMGA